jgi:hypothetical protein
VLFEAPIMDPAEMDLEVSLHDYEGPASTLRGGNKGSIGEDVQGAFHVILDGEMLQRTD